MSTSTAFTPSISRAVHFVENQAKRRHLAAVVIAVHDPDEFKRDPKTGDIIYAVPPGTVDLHVFGVTGSFVQRAVRQSDDTSVRRTWHRPEYVA